ncbi:hypothetical protein [Vibrio hippocampi]|uniref:Uncharacterized protein n=1 Tax=Vibrio hippocampi TaxID=654686 RepID=A0ABM8ZL57_9VIBR|nr:hypothetical protein [Vibrio hippocampi]CAH0529038.1 hypothetical protein VHP8226_03019 [Vibrio hippocampi]
MTPLEQALRNLGVVELAYVAEHQKLLLQVCERNNTTFVATRSNKPDSSVHQTLLGLFTKLNIDAVSVLSRHSEQIQTMQQTFEQHLGRDHGSRFKLEQVVELVLVTHIWLYIQGLLGMDYSLANDHARQCSELIAQLTQQDIETSRTAFNQSYYLGIRQYESTRPKRSLLMRLFEKWFN